MVNVEIWKMAAAALLITVGIQSIVWPAGHWTLGNYPKGTAGATDADWAYILQTFGAILVTSGLQIADFISMDTCILGAFSSHLGLSYKAHGALPALATVSGPIIIVWYYMRNGNKDKHGAVPSGQKAFGDAVFRLHNFFIALAFAAIVVNPAKALEAGGMFTGDNMKKLAANDQVLLTVRNLAATVVGRSIMALMVKEDNGFLGPLVTSITMIVTTLMTNKFSTPAFLVMMVAHSAIAVVILKELNGPRLVDCDALLFINDAFEGRAKSVSATPPPRKSKSRRGKN